MGLMIERQVGEALGRGRRTRGAVSTSDDAISASTQRALTRRSEATLLVSLFRVRI
jgi:hypothetical protein